MDDCVLKLDGIFFDSINFKRLGSPKKNDKNELELSLSVNIGVSESEPDVKKVSLKMIGEKKDEYYFDVQVSGFFVYEGDANDTIISQNTAAILMPYLRSEISLLTAQPSMEPVVIPPLNIAAMIEESKMQNN